MAARKANSKPGARKSTMKQGKLKPGQSGRKVTNPQPAFAIGLSEARREGRKTPSENS